MATVEERAKWKKDREREDLRAVLATEPGRRFVWKLLEEAGIFHELPLRTPEEGQFQGAEIARQNHGKRLLAEVLTVNPAAYNLMELEAKRLREIENPAEDESDEVS